jgi:hypothetical protein
MLAEGLKLSLGSKIVAKNGDNVILLNALQIGQELKVERI